MLIRWSLVTLPTHDQALITKEEDLEIIRVGLRGRRFELKLIMKSSIDGFSARVFHE